MTELGQRTRPSKIFCVIDSKPFQPLFELRAQNGNSVAQFSSHLKRYLLELWLFGTMVLDVRCTVSYLELKNFLRLQNTAMG